MSTCCTLWHGDFEEPVDLQCLECVVIGLTGVDKSGMVVGDSLEQPLEGEEEEPEMWKCLFTVKTVSCYILIIFVEVIIRMD